VFAALGLCWQNEVATINSVISLFATLGASWNFSLAENLKSLDLQA
jgi:hypothetical protein